MRPQARSATTRRAKRRVIGKNRKIKPVQRAKERTIGALRRVEPVAYRAIGGVDVEPDVAADNAKD
jgi:hypothetical protein